ncbi:MAG: hypothetical protein M9939_17290 [Mesorhizobium sp.]|nr:YiiX/YebB-like N1pC/P60 family cysteine hydrolase [Mesorhizobium sp.]MCO5162892.1 hypothetical protein [Mesorhizobium sp.]
MRGFWVSGMSVFRRAAVAAGLALVALLSACTHDPGRTAGGGQCCGDAERQPRWLVAAVEPFAPVFGEIVGPITWRHGYLDDEAIQKRFVTGLRPLDIVVVSSKGRLTGRLIPGLFQHATVYVGSESELRALGMWSHPSVVPHREAIRGGARFIEADRKGVHLSPPSAVLDTDRAVALRPRIATPGWQRRAAATLFGALGTKFDFNFDAARADRLFCAELVCHAMPELRLPRDKVYGRDTIIPDRVVYEAARGNPRLRLVKYVAGDRSGIRTPGRTQLLDDLLKAWPE